MTLRCVTYLLAAGILFVALADGAPAASHATPQGAETFWNKKVKPHSGWGYGRGWCYWHPYVCRGR